MITTDRLRKNQRCLGRVHFRRRHDDGANRTRSRDGPHCGPLLPGLWDPRRLCGWLLCLLRELRPRDAQGRGYAGASARGLISLEKPNDGSGCWGGWIRTTDYLIQRQEPYRLATPQWST